MVSDGNLSGDIILKGGGDSASIPDIPRAVLKALYHSVVKPKANLTAQYKDCYTVTANDINQLALRLIQWSRQYDVQATGLTISVNRLKQKGSDFNSSTTYPTVEEFLKQEPSQSTAIDSMGISISLLYENRDTGVVENIEANIRVENFVGHQVERDIIVMGHIRNISGMTPPFDLKIGYTDYIVAKSLQATFEDWLESLSKFDVVKENMFMRSFSTYGFGEIFSIGFQVIKFAPVFSSLAIGWGLFDLFPQSGNGLYAFLVSLLVIYAFSDCAFRMTVARFQHPSIPGPPFLEINVGDKNKRAKYVSHVELRRKSIQKELWAILVAFLTSVGAGLLIKYFF